MRVKTGRDLDVQEYVFQAPAALEIFNKLIELYRFLLPQYLAEGRHFVRIGIGCTGGQHRSVALVERLSTELAKEKLAGIEISVTHRDI